MKNIKTLLARKIMIIILVNFIANVNAQSDFNTEMKEMTLKLISRLKEKENKKIAVWDFTDLDGNVISIGKYISEQVSDDFSNSNEVFQIIDRNHLQTILKEHKLKSEGYIDLNTAKELGKFAGVDYVVTGKITILSNHINLTIKILSTETALINASISGNIQMDENIKELLGISTAGNRGFNGNPINSDEILNNPETVTKKCIINNTGDYCFENKSKIKLSVMLSENQTLTLAPGQTQCFYDLKVNVINYSAFIYSKTPDGQEYLDFSGFGLRANGQIKIEQCKSKTLQIN